MKKRQIPLIYVFMCICCTVGTIQATQKYEVIDLGSGYTPCCFNDSGQVVIQNVFNTSQLYLWDNGSISNIFTATWFGRININNSGTIVGFYNDTIGGPGASFKITAGSTETIPSAAFWNINDPGQIVQTSTNPTTGQYQTHLLNADGTVTDCGNTLTTFTAGVTVSNSGQVTGATGNIDEDNFTGFVWDAASGMHYLSPLAGDMGALGFDITSVGQVVGYSASSMPPGSTPWEWDWNLVMWDENGAILDMGCKIDPMGPNPTMNNLNQMTGTLKLPNDTDFESYFWQEGMGFIKAHDLSINDSLWTVTDLYQINELGQMIGSAKLDGQYHGVILNPIPEPGTIGLMLLGMVCLKRK